MKLYTFAGIVNPFLKNRARVEVNNLKTLIDSFAQKTVMVIGDVMIDTYIWGNVNRISPEAPVPVLAVEGRENRLGGAANVALNIASLGAKPILCAVVGNDHHKDLFAKLIKKRQITDEGLLPDPERRTTVKTRVIAQNQQLLRVDDEITDSLSLNIEQQFIEHIKQLIDANTIDAIIFEDYNKGVLTEKVIEAVVKKAHRKKIPTLVDPKKKNFLAYRGVTLFKPNFKEMTEGLKRDINKADMKALFEAAHELHHNDIELVMITLSELGVFISEGRNFHHIPAEIRDIADVSGAGDTVISVAALGLASGLSPRQIAALANLAGGLVCEKVGVVPISKELLLKEARNYIAFQETTDGK